MTTNQHPDPEPARGAQAVEGHDDLHDEMREHDHREDMSVLQQIIVRLSREHAGADPRMIRAELEVAMEQAGLSTGAKKWIDDTATEISAGRVVVTDTRHDVRPDDDRAVSDVAPEQSLRADERG